MNDIERKLADQKSAEQKLMDMGIAIPAPPKAVASYVGWVKSGNLLFVSGQLPMRDGALVKTGKLGDSVTLAQGEAAARVCAINIIAQIKDACGGDLQRVVRIVKLNGFVASSANFTDQPKVINGASNLMAEVFGDAGVHSRAAVGVASLPLDACVEVDAIVEIQP